MDENKSKIFPKGNVVKEATKKMTKILHIVRAIGGEEVSNFWSLNLKKVIIFSIYS